MGDFSLLYKSSKVCYAVNEKKTVAAYPRKQERSKIYGRLLFSKKTNKCKRQNRLY